MSKKIELKVHVLCEKCKTTIFTTTAKVHGVKTISLDADKGVLTVMGSADAVKLVDKLRKAKVSAEIMSLGPEKPPEKKEEKKEEKKDEKKIECIPICYCNCKPCYCGYKPPYICPPPYGNPPFVYVEQYPQGNCVIS